MLLGRLYLYYVCTYIRVFQDILIYFLLHTEIDLKCNPYSFFFAIENGLNAECLPLNVVYVFYCIYNVYNFYVNLNGYITVI